MPKNTHRFHLKIAQPDPKTPTARTLSTAPSPLTSDWPHRKSWGGTTFLPRSKIAHVFGRALKEGAATVKALLDKYANLCREFEHAKDEQLTSTAAELLQKGYCTLTEEYFVSKCHNPSATTATKLNKRLVDIADKFDYSSVHATIRERVSQYQI